MSIKPKPFDDQQLSIFACLRPAVDPVPGGMSISMRLRMAISAAIRTAGKKVEDICLEIYRLTGEEVSLKRMRKWAAPSTDFTNECEDHNGNKRWGIPAEIVPAFCQVTGCWEALFIQAEAGNFKALKGKDVVRARMGLLKEEITMQTQEIADLLAVARGTVSKHKKRAAHSNNSLVASFVG